MYTHTSMNTVRPSFQSYFHAALLACKIDMSFSNCIFPEYTLFHFFFFIHQNKRVGVRTGTWRGSLEEDLLKKRGVLITGGTLVLYSRMKDSILSNFTCSPRFFLGMWRAGDFLVTLGCCRDILRCTRDILRGK